MKRGILFSLYFSQWEQFSEFLIVLSSRWASQPRRERGPERERGGGGLSLLMNRSCLRVDEVDTFKSSRTEDGGGDDASER